MYKKNSLRSIKFSCISAIWAVLFLISHKTFIRESSLLAITFMLLTLFNLAVSIICAASVSESSQETAQSGASVSVIIPCRNEQDTLQACLDSIDHIIYNREKLEIILVNDRSEDDTGDLLTAFSHSKSHVKTITIDSNNSGFSGKTHAVECGVQASTGEILFFTDADCIVPYTWITGLAGHNPDPHTIYAGFVYPEPSGPSAISRLFGSLQCIDWIRFCTIGMAWSRMGRPLSIFGNNFAVSKFLYEKSGGISTGGFHYTEDYAFMNAAVQKGASVTFRLSRDSAVRTAPESHFRAFIRQRMRWFLGSTHRGFWSNILPASAIAFFWLSAALALAGNTMAGISGLCILFLCDTIVLVKPLRLFKKLHLLTLLPLFEVFFSLYTVCTVLALTFKKRVVWKNDTMETNTP